MLLGRIQSTADPRTVRLKNYVNLKTLPVPPSQEMVESTPVWPMLANDRFNCCTSTAAGHMIHHWTAANQHGIFLTDDDIIQAHARLTRDHLMECVSMLNALKFWRNTGIGGHQIHSFVGADKASAQQLRCVIHLFGSGYVGLDLPGFACAGPPAGWPDIPWAIPPSIPADAAAPNPSRGHCVAAVGYDQQSIYCVTWGRLKSMSWEFFERYAEEVYAVLSTDWVAKNAKCPTGFDTVMLERDLSLVHARKPTAPAPAAP
ncbi:MAG TPA: hypothetical protein VME18_06295 [Acidobacteriaceae bacterium]|nr:hypothetical protein [Acidobacteriaceae bacterium]